MYIIELIVKKFLKREKDSGYNPLEEETDDEIEYENCEQIFMTIDSSGETLACTKCGLVVNKKDMKRRNIFRP